MERISLARRPCPIARAMDQIGDAWSMLLVRDIYLGTHRFADLQAQLGIAPNILTRRLEQLVEHGVLEARTYSTRPLRREYVLTEKGEGLLSVLLAVATWGNEWLAPKGAPLLPVDALTGKAVRPVLIDALSGKPLGPGSVGLVAGPGAPAALKKTLRKPRLFVSQRKTP